MVVFNKRGYTDIAKILKWLGFVAGILILLYLINLLLLHNNILDSSNYNQVDVLEIPEELSDGVRKGNLLGFEELWEIPEIKFFKLKYIFGMVPGRLLALYGIGPISAGIIVMALWWIMFINIYEIVNVFGYFGGRYTGLLVSLLTMVVIANLKGLVFISLTIFLVAALIGVFAVVGGFLLIFALAFSFFFLGGKIRDWAKKRQAENAIFRTKIGSQIAKEGINVAGDLAFAAADQGRRA